MFFYRHCIILCVGNECPCFLLSLHVELGSATSLLRRAGQSMKAVKPDISIRCVRAVVGVMWCGAARLSACATCVSVSWCPVCYPCHVTALEFCALVIGGVPRRNPFVRQQKHLTERVVVFGHEVRLRVIPAVVSLPVVRLRRLMAHSRNGMKGVRVSHARRVSGQTDVRLHRFRHSSSRK